MPEKNDNYDFSNLINDIRHEKISSSYVIAMKTEEILERIITDGGWTTAQELMNVIRERVGMFATSLPHQVTSTNIMRHLLKIVREEYDAGFKSKFDGEQSLHHLVTSDTDAHEDYSRSLDSLRSSLLNHLCEYKVELETSVDNIAAQAPEHIHSNEIILTMGKSDTVELFLKLAARARKFQVIVVESAPLYHGHTMASSLAKANIQTTIIPDSEIFAIMSRVNKVIIGVHSVMADGGLRASSGVHGIALAAKHFSVPVIVLAHMYKLSPVYVCSHEQDAFNTCASPANVLPYSAGSIHNKVEVHNPMFDYVPPELVTLFISHQGGNAPSYVYRLLSELYHPDDY